MLSCPYISNQNKLGGHNVCMFRYVVPSKNGLIHKWAHISNRHAGMVQWGFKNIEDVVRHVIDSCGGGDSKSLGWSYCDINLKMIKRDNPCTVNVKK